MLTIWFINILFSSVNYEKENLYERLQQRNELFFVFLQIFIKIKKKFSKIVVP